MHPRRHPPPALLPHCTRSEKMNGFKVKVANEEVQLAKSSSGPQITLPAVIISDWDDWLWAFWQVPGTTPVLLFRIKNLAKYDDTGGTSGTFVRFACRLLFYITEDRAGRVFPGADRRLAGAWGRDARKCPGTHTQSSQGSAVAQPITSTVPLYLWQVSTVDLVEI